MKDLNTDDMNDELGNLHNFILNDFDLTVDVNAHLASRLALAVKCEATPILLHFRQVHGSLYCTEVTLLAYPRNKLGSYW